MVATITNGTHTPVERSEDPARNRATYSGKEKTHTYNTTITTTPEDIIIRIGKTVPDSIGDLTLQGTRRIWVPYMMRQLIQTHQKTSIP